MSQPDSDWQATLSRIATALEILCDINDPDERYHHTRDNGGVAVGLRHWHYPGESADEARMP